MIQTLPSPVQEAGCNVASLSPDQNIFLAQMQDLLPETPSEALVCAVQRHQCLNDAVAWVLRQAEVREHEDGGKAPLSRPCQSRRPKRNYFLPHLLRTLDTSKHTVLSSLLCSKLRLFLAAADRGRLGAASPAWYEVSWGKGGRKRQGIAASHLEQLDRKLFCASGGGGEALNVPLMRVLLNWNASPSFRGEGNTTALHYAALKDDDTCTACTCLLQAGASRTASDAIGRTPRDWAQLESVKALLTVPTITAFAATPVTCSAGQQQQQPSAKRSKHAGLSVNNSNSTL